MKASVKSKYSLNTVNYSKNKYKSRKTERVSFGTKGNRPTNHPKHHGGWFNKR